MPNYVDIKSLKGSDTRLVKQDLKFRTGTFIWRVVFNIPLNPASVNNNNLTVLNAQGTPVKTKIAYNAQLKAIEIEPQEPYSAGETYTLHITRNVESKGGQRLKEEINMEFAV